MLNWLSNLIIDKLIDWLIYRFIDFSGPWVPADGGGGWDGGGQGGGVEAAGGTGRQDQGGRGWGHGGRETAARDFL